ncbi:RNA polymerase sigma factor [Microbacterium schleiferi]|uniref:Sigma-70 family RNA polymerase sigma factor n=1 Tax=Microbacterium schleiferi TaxID=69362 RepID=A0ABU7V6K1_9MICO
MSDQTGDTARRRHVEAEIKAMLRDQRLDGIVRTLESQFHGQRQLAEDAVLEAIERVLKKIEHDDVAHVLSYIQMVAVNYVKKELTKQKRFGGGIDSLDAKLADEEMEWEPQADLSNDDTPGRLDEQIGRDLLNGLKAITATWNDNIRVVTNLVLDHTFADDYDWMTADDLAQEASAILGIDVSAATASMWKARGLKRLREHFNFDES